MASRWLLLLALFFLLTWPRESSSRPLPDEGPSTQTTILPWSLGDRSPRLSTVSPAASSRREGEATLEVPSDSSSVCDPEVVDFVDVGDDEQRKIHALSRSELVVGRQIPVPDLRNHIPSRPSLPRMVAERLFPFRNDDLPAVLQMLGIPSASPLARHMRRTVSTCQGLNGAGGAEGKARCASSVEEMREFARSTLGSKHVEVMQTITAPGIGDGEEPMTIKQVTVGSAGDRSSSVVCDDLVFPFSVFLCRVSEEWVESVEVTLVRSTSGKVGKQEQQEELKAIMQCYYSYDDDAGDSMESSRSSVEKQRGSSSFHVGMAAVAEEGRQRQRQRQGRCEWVGEGSVVWVGVRMEGGGDGAAWRNEKHHHGDYQATNSWQLVHQKGVTHGTKGGGGGMSEQRSSGSGGRGMDEQSGGK